MYIILIILKICMSIFKLKLCFKIKIKNLQGKNAIFIKEW